MSFTFFSVGADRVSFTFFSVGEDRMSFPALSLLLVVAVDLVLLLLLAFLSAVYSVSSELKLPEL